MKHSLKSKSKSKERQSEKLVIVISNKEYSIEVNDIVKCAFEKANCCLNSNCDNDEGEKRMRITLPKSVETIEDFRRYLNAVLLIRKKGRESLASELFEVFELLKLIDISLVLKDEDITQVLVEDKLRHSLTKENSLMIIAKYTQLQSQNQHIHSIESLINDCETILAKNLNEIIIFSSRSNIGDDYANDELMSLPDKTFNAILTRYFIDSHHQGYDHSSVVQLLMKKRRIANGDVFSLIDEEKTHSLQVFEKTVADKTALNPSLLEWTLTNCCFKADFYRESEVYLYDSLMIKFYSRYDYQKDEYSAAIQLQPEQGNPFKEEHIFLMTQTSLNGISNSSAVNFNYINTSASAKIVILRLSNATFQLKANTSKITLQVNLEVNHILSSLSQYISQKFYMYYMLPSISRLSHKCLWITLKSKYLHLRSEDEALTAVLTWMKSKSNAKEESLLSLFSIVKWREISFDSLLELITSFSKLLIALPHLEGLVKEEFHRRLKAEYSRTDSSKSFTNDLIDKLMSKSLKNSSCFQPMSMNANEKKALGINTSVLHTTDNTTLISRNNISFINDNLNTCSHLEELQSNSVIMKTNSSLARQIQHSDYTNPSLKRTQPRAFLKTEANDRKSCHTKNKSLNLELNLLTNSSGYANTSISKRNDTQLKTQLEIIEKKISKSKHSKHIRHNTSNQYSNMTFKSPKSTQQSLKTKPFTSSNQ